MKKVWLLLLAVLLLVASAATVSAEEPEYTPNDALVRQAEQLYIDCRRAANRGSFHGYCGTMVSYQLWKLGIEEHAPNFNGNTSYNAYEKVEVTTGGYGVRTYSAREYTLKEALNTISAGKRTVRNIMVCFQATSTEAGSQYGHVLLINFIEDGMVYFTESYYAMGKPEGDAVVCTVEEFANYFLGWTLYEGVVYFGDKAYADSCTAYGTDAYLQVRFDSNLRSQPCLLEENDCRRIRSLKGGEILRATGVFENHEGDLFYQVEDGNVTGYVSANAVFVLQTETDPGALTHAQLPSVLEEGKPLTLVGRVKAESAVIDTLLLELTDKEGNVCLSVQTDAQGSVSDLAGLNRKLDKTVLKNGSYCLRISARFVNAVVENGAISTVAAQQELCRQILTVGNTAETFSLTPKTEDQVRDGWFEENDTWYCYENGKPCTGWVTRVGIRYYLREDGSVTTGWAKPDGVRLYFSSTGALCSGWTTVGKDTYYWFANGVPAKGLQQIDGNTYFFDTAGILVKTGTITWEGKTYNIGADGTATKV